MPPCVESPVHCQCTDGNCGDGSAIGDIRTRPVGRRRILVQTDTGNVLGMEFHRADNVHAVKRRLQALLHLPMEQVALVCGDTILKNDLNELKKDSPLLLTRSLQRSLSTPCLSPTSEFLTDAGPNHLIEVVGGLICCSQMRMIIKEIGKAIKCGIEPVPISTGLGGAYYFRNSKGESVAIIKPTDEEPLAPNNPKGFVGRMLGEYGLKKAIRVGETGVREVAAYLLDHDSFAKVPPTVLVEITHHVFHINNATSAHGNSGKLRLSVTKLASCQAFVCHDSDASDCGSSGFSVSAVHRIGILDIRIFNTDRHAGNILVKRIDPPGGSRMYVNNSLELIPIDHGLCLPESLEDPYFEWLHWPQASVPFSEEELDYIHRLDPNKDVDMLRAELPMLRVTCLRMLILSTTFLKKAATAGFCLAEIGELMSRDGLEEVSQLELFCLKAKEEVESKLANVMVDDDDYFSDNSFGGDELEEQFEFEEDNECGEDTGHYTSSQSQSMYMHSHPGSPPEFSVPKVAFKEKFTVPHCLSNSLNCGNLSRVSENSVKRTALTHWPRDVQAEQSCLETFCEGSPPEEEVLTFSLPSKQRTSCVNGGRVVSRAISVLTSPNRSSSKSAQSHCSPRSTSQISSSKDGVYQRMASWQISKTPVKAMSFKSASLSDRKQRSIFLERRTFGLPGVSASETLGKTMVAGSTTAISFGEMSGEEWICFMECFEQILQEAFATRCSERVGYRQRLGISLPVFRQRHFQ